MRRTVVVGAAAAVLGFGLGAPTAHAAGIPVLCAQGPGVAWTYGTGGTTFSCPFTSGDGQFALVVLHNGLPVSWATGTVDSTACTAMAGTLGGPAAAKVCTLGPGTHTLTLTVSAAAILGQAIVLPA